MSEPSPPQKSGRPESAPALTPRPNPVAALISRMSIAQMTLAVVLAVLLWQWFDTQRQIGALQQDVARRLTEMESSNKAAQLLITQQQETMRSLSGKIALQEEHYTETQNQRAALETLYQELSSSRDDMALAQAEQLLLIAGQQLQLAANVKAALIAMQQADDTLRHMNRPSLAGLHTRIVQSMDRLRAVPNVDVTELSLRLDNVINAVDKLPLLQDQRSLEHPDESPLPSDASVWQKLGHEIWQDVRQLVIVADTDQDIPPLLAPSQTFFLRENLKLRLLSARINLLLRDETNYKHDLQEAHGWMTRYFDMKSGDSTQAVAALQKLRNSAIRIELPDISDSLEAVRAWRAAHGKPAQ